MAKNCVKRRGWLGFFAGCAIIIIIGITLWRVNWTQTYSSFTSAPLRDGHTALRIMSPGIWSSCALEQPRKGDIWLGVYPEEQGLRWWIDYLPSRSLPGPPAGYENLSISVDCVYAPKGQELDRRGAEILKSANEAHANTVSRSLSCPLGPAVQVDSSHIEEAYKPATDFRATYIFAGPDSGAPNYQIKVTCFATPKTKREMFDAVAYIVSHLKFVDVNSQTD